MSLKAVLSFGSVDHAWVFMAKLARQIEPDTAALIIEDRTSLKNRLRFLKDRFRRYPAGEFFDQMCLIGFKYLFRKNLCRHEAAQAREYLKRFPVLWTDSMNDPKVAQFLRERQADFLINLGTGYVRKPVLETLKSGAINIHAGLNPRYRGVDPNVWAVYEKNFQDLGGTVHLMDEGLDTGKILYRNRIAVIPSDTVEQITLRSIEEAMKQVPAILAYYKEYGVLPEPQLEAMEAKTYGWYGLSHYLKAQSHLKEKILEGRK